MRKIINLEEELQKCKDSIVYYWNSYIRRDDQEELTEEEWNIRLKHLYLLNSRQSKIHPKWL